MAPMASSSHVHRGLGFHRGIPMLQRLDNPQRCPQRRKRQWRLSLGTTTPATHSTKDKSLHLRSHDTSIKRNPTQPEAPPRHHQQAPVSPRPLHQDGIRPASSSRKKRSTTVLPQCLLPTCRAPPAPPVPSREDLEQADLLCPAAAMSVALHRPKPPLAAISLRPPPSAAVAAGAHPHRPQPPPSSEHRPPPPTTHLSVPPARPADPAGATLDLRP
jgi:hypothetical protein